MGMSSDAGVVALKNLALLCVCAGVVILSGYLAYSQTGCSLVCPDGNGTSELAFVIEGDLDPSDQMLRVSGHDADANTKVIVSDFLPTTSSGASCFDEPLMLNSPQA